MGCCNRAAADVGGLEDRQVRALLLAAIEHAQQPAVALRGRIGPRNEDRLAEAGVRTGGEGGALAGLEVVMDQPVMAWVADLGIGDVAADDPAVAVVAHAEALV